MKLRNIRFRILFLTTILLQTNLLITGMGLYEAIPYAEEAVYPEYVSAQANSPFFTLMDCQSDQEADSLVLVDFYNETGGVNWTLPDSAWLSGKMLRWKGIGPDINDCMVKNIRLISTNITGVLPARLGDLSKVELIYFHDNNLWGIEDAILDSRMLTEYKLGILHLDGNCLNFDIETTVPKIREIITSENLFTYVNQAKIPIYQDGEALIVKAGGTLENNNYTWNIGGTSQSAQKGNNQYELNSLDERQVIVYCKVTNEMVTYNDPKKQQLVLQSQFLQPIVIDYRFDSTNLKLDNCDQEGPPTMQIDVQLKREGGLSIDGVGELLFYLDSLRLSFDYNKAALANPQLILPAPLENLYTYGNALVSEEQSISLKADNRLETGVLDTCQSCTKLYQRYLDNAMFADYFEVFTVGEFITIATLQFDILNEAATPQLTLGGETDYVYDHLVGKPIIAITDSTFNENNSLACSCQITDFRVVEISCDENSNYYWITIGWEGDIDETTYVLSTDEDDLGDANQHPNSDANGQARYRWLLNSPYELKLLDTVQSCTPFTQKGHINKLEIESITYDCIERGQNEQVWVKSNIYVSGGLSQYTLIDTVQVYYETDNGFEPMPLDTTLMEEDYLTIAILVNQPWELTFKDDSLGCTITISDSLGMVFPKMTGVYPTYCVNDPPHEIRDITIDETGTAFKNGEFSIATIDGIPLAGIHDFGDGRGIFKPTTLGVGEFLISYCYNYSNTENITSCFPICDSMQITIKEGNEGCYPICTDSLAEATIMSAFNPDFELVDSIYVNSPGIVLKLNDIETIKLDFENLEGQFDALHEINELNKYISWSIDDDVVQNDMGNMSFNPNAIGIGIHEICVEVGYPDCIKKDCKMIQVLEVPTANLQFSNAICNGQQYCLNLQVKAGNDSPWGMGNSEIDLSYNTDVLSFKDDYVPLQFDASTINCTNIYQSQQTSSNDNTGVIFIKIALMSTDIETNCPFIETTTWQDIGQLCFDALQGGVDPELTITRADFITSNNGFVAVNTNTTPAWKDTIDCICTESITTLIKDEQAFCVSGRPNLVSAEATLVCSHTNCEEYAITWYTDENRTLVYNNETLIHTDSTGCQTDEIRLYAQSKCSKDDTKEPAGELMILLYPQVQTPTIQQVADSCRYVITPNCSDDSLSLQSFILPIGSAGGDTSIMVLSNATPEACTQTFTIAYDACNILCPQLQATSDTAITICSHDPINCSVRVINDDVQETALGAINWSGDIDINNSMINMDGSINIGADVLEANTCEAEVFKFRAILPEHTIGVCPADTVWFTVSVLPPPATQAQLKIDPADSCTITVVNPCPNITTIKYAIGVDILAKNWTVGDSVTYVPDHIGIREMPVVAFVFTDPTNICHSDTLRDTLNCRLPICPQLSAISEDTLLVCSGEALNLLVALMGDASKETIQWSTDHPNSPLLMMGDSLHLATLENVDSCAPLSYTYTAKVPAHTVEDCSNADSVVFVVQVWPLPDFGVEVDTTAGCQVRLSNVCPAVAVHYTVAGNLPEAGTIYTAMPLVGEVDTTLVTFTLSYDTALLTYDTSSCVRSLSGRVNCFGGDCPSLHLPTGVESEHTICSGEALDLNIDLINEAFLQHIAWWHNDHLMDTGVTTINTGTLIHEDGCDPLALEYRATIPDSTVDHCQGTTVVFTINVLPKPVGQAELQIDPTDSCTIVVVEFCPNIAVKYAIGTDIAAQNWMVGEKATYVPADVGIREMPVVAFVFTDTTKTCPSDTLRETLDCRLSICPQLSAISEDTLLVCSGEALNLLVALMGDASKETIQWSTDHPNSPLLMMGDSLHLATLENVDSCAPLSYTYTAKVPAHTVEDCSNADSVVFVVQVWPLPDFGVEVDTTAGCQVRLSNVCPAVGVHYTVAGDLPEAGTIYTATPLVGEVDTTLVTFTLSYDTALLTYDTSSCVRSLSGRVNCFGEDCPTLYLPTGVESEYTICSGEALDLNIDLINEAFLQHIAWWHNDHLMDTGVTTINTGTLIHEDGCDPLALEYRATIPDSTVDHCKGTTVVFTINVLPKPVGQAELQIDPTDSCTIVVVESCPNIAVKYAIGTDIAAENWTVGEEATYVPADVGIREMPVVAFVFTDTTKTCPSDTLRETLDCRLSICPQLSAISEDTLLVCSGEALNLLVALMGDVSKEAIQWSTDHPNSPLLMMGDSLHLATLENVDSCAPLSYTYTAKIPAHTVEDCSNVDSVVFVVQVWPLPDFGVEVDTTAGCQVRLSNVCPAVAVHYTVAGDLPEAGTIYTAMPLVGEVDTTLVTFTLSYDTALLTYDTSSCVRSLSGRVNCFGGDCPSLHLPTGVESEHTICSGEALDLNIDLINEAFLQHIAWWHNDHLMDTGVTTINTGTLIHEDGCDPLALEYRATIPDSTVDHCKGTTVVFTINVLPKPVGQAELQIDPTDSCTIVVVESCPNIAVKYAIGTDIAAQNWTVGDSLTYVPADAGIREMPVVAFVFTDTTKTCPSDTLRETLDCRLPICPELTVAGADTIVICSGAAVDLQLGLMGDASPEAIQWVVDTTENLIVATGDRLHTGQLRNEQSCEPLTYRYTATVPAHTIANCPDTARVTFVVQVLPPPAFDVFVTTDSCQVHISTACPDVGVHYMVGEDANLVADTLYTAMPLAGEVDSSIVKFILNYPDVLCADTLSSAVHCIGEDCPKLSLPQEVEDTLFICSGDQTSLTVVLTESTVSSDIEWSLTNTNTIIERGTTMTTNPLFSTTDCDPTYVQYTARIPDQTIDFCLATTVTYTIAVLPPPEAALTLTYSTDSCSVIAQTSHCPAIKVEQRVNGGAFESDQIHTVNPPVDSFQRDTVVFRLTDDRGRPSCTMDTTVVIACDRTPCPQLFAISADTLTVCSGEAPYLKVRSNLELFSDFIRWTRTFPEELTLISGDSLAIGVLQNEADCDPITYQYTARIPANTTPNCATETQVTFVVQVLPPPDFGVSLTKDSCNIVVDLTDACPDIQVHYSTDGGANFEQGTHYTADPTVGEIDRTRVVFEFRNEEQTCTASVIDSVHCYGGDCPTLSLPDPIDNNLMVCSGDRLVLSVTIVDLSKVSAPEQVEWRVDTADAIIGTGLDLATGALFQEDSCAPLTLTYTASIPDSTIGNCLGTPVAFTITVLPPVDFGATVQYSADSCSVYVTDVCPTVTVSYTVDGGNEPHPDTIYTAMPPIGEVDTTQVTFTLNYDTISCARTLSGQVNCSGEDCPTLSLSATAQREYTICAGEQVDLSIDLIGDEFHQHIQWWHQDNLMETGVTTLNTGILTNEEGCDPIVLKYSATIPENTVGSCEVTEIVFTVNVLPTPVGQAELQIDPIDSCTIMVVEQCKNIEIKYAIGTYIAAEAWTVGDRVTYVPDHIGIREMPVVAVVFTDIIHNICRSDTLWDTLSCRLPICPELTSGSADTIFVCSGSAVDLRVKLIGDASPEAIQWVVDTTENLIVATGDSLNTGRLRNEQSCDPITYRYTATVPAHTIAPCPDTAQVTFVVQVLPPPAFDVFVTTDSCQVHISTACPDVGVHYMVGEDANLVADTLYTAMPLAGEVDSSIVKFILNYPDVLCADTLSSAVHCIGEDCPRLSLPQEVEDTLFICSGDQASLTVVLTGSTVPNDIEWALTNTNTIIERGTTMTTNPLVSLTNCDPTYVQYTATIPDQTIDFCLATTVTYTIAVLPPPEAALTLTYSTDSCSVIAQTSHCPAIKVEQRVNGGAFESDQIHTVNPPADSFQRDTVVFRLTDDRGRPSCTMDTTVVIACDRTPCPQLFAISADTLTVCSGEAPYLKVRSNLELFSDFIRWTRTFPEELTLISGDSLAIGVLQNEADCDPITYHYTARIPANTTPNCATETQVTFVVQVLPPPDFGVSLTRDSCRIAVDLTTVCPAIQIRYSTDGGATFETGTQYTAEPMVEETDRTKVVFEFSTDEQLCTASLIDSVHCYGGACPVLKLPDHAENKFIVCSSDSLVLRVAIVDFINVSAPEQVEWRVDTAAAIIGTGLDLATGALFQEDSCAPLTLTYTASIPDSTIGNCLGTPVAFTITVLPPVDFGATVQYSADSCSVYVTNTCPEVTVSYTIHEESEAKEDTVYTVIPAIGQIKQTSVFFTLTNDTLIDKNIPCFATTLPEQIVECKSPYTLMTIDTTAVCVIQTGTYTLSVSIDGGLPPYTISGTRNTILDAAGTLLIEELIAGDFVIEVHVIDGLGQDTTINYNVSCYSCDFALSHNDQYTCLQADNGRSIVSTELSMGGEPPYVVENVSNVYATSADLQAWVIGDQITINNFDLFLDPTQTWSFTVRDGQGCVAQTSSTKFPFSSLDFESSFTFDQATYCITTTVATVTMDAPIEGGYFRGDHIIDGDNVTATIDLTTAETGKLLIQYCRDNNNLGLIDGITDCERYCIDTVLAIYPNLADVEQMIDMDNGRDVVHEKIDSVILKITNIKDVEVLFNDLKENGLFAMEGTEAINEYVQWKVNDTPLRKIEDGTGRAVFYPHQSGVGDYTISVELAIAEWPTDCAHPIPAQLLRVLADPIVTIKDSIVCLNTENFDLSSLWIDSTLQTGRFSITDTLFTINGSNQLSYDDQAVWEVDLPYSLTVTYTAEDENGFIATDTAELIWIDCVDCSEWITLDVNQNSSNTLELCDGEISKVTITTNCNTHPYWEQTAFAIIYSIKEQDADFDVYDALVNGTEGVDWLYLGQNIAGCAAGEIPIGGIPNNTCSIADLRAAILPVRMTRNDTTQAYEVVDIPENIVPNCQGHPLRVNIYPTQLTFALDAGTCDTAPQVRILSADSSQTCHHFPIGENCSIGTTATYPIDTSFSAAEIVALFNEEEIDEIFLTLDCDQTLDINTSIDCNCSCQIDRIYRRLEACYEGDHQTAEYVLYIDSIRSTPSTNNYTYQLDGQSPIPFTDTTSIRFLGDGEEHTILIEHGTGENCQEIIRIPTQSCFCPVTSFTILEGPYCEAGDSMYYLTVAWENSVLDTTAFLIVEGAIDTPRLDAPAENSNGLGTFAFRVGQPYNIAWGSEHEFCNNLPIIQGNSPDCSCTLSQNFYIQSLACIPDNEEALTLFIGWENGPFPTVQLTDNNGNAPEDDSDDPTIMSSGFARFLLPISDTTINIIVKDLVGNCTDTLSEQHLWTESNMQWNISGHNKRLFSCSEDSTSVYLEASECELPADSIGFVVVYKLDPATQERIFQPSFEVRELLVSGTEGKDWYRGDAIIGCRADEMTIPVVPLQNRSCSRVSFTSVVVPASFIQNELGEWAFDDFIIGCGYQIINHFVYPKTFTPEVIQESSCDQAAILQFVAEDNGVCHIDTATTLIAECRDTTTSVRFTMSNEDFFSRSPSEACRQDTVIAVPHHCDCPCDTADFELSNSQDTICVGETISFTISSEEADSSFWYRNDSLIQASEGITDLTYTFATANTGGEQEQIRLRLRTYAIDGSILCEDDTVITIVIRADGDCNPCNLVADFSVPADTICLGETITISNLSNKADSSFLYLQDDLIAAVETTSNMAFTSTTLGERELTLIIYTYTTTGEISCGDTIRQTILTTDEGDCQPCDLVADFSVPADTICLGESITIGNLSTQADSSFLYLQDDLIAAVETTSNIEFTATTLGERELTLIIYTYTTTGEISCADTIRQTILTTDEGDCNPCDLVADFSVPADPICLGETITISNLSNKADSSFLYINGDLLTAVVTTSNIEFTATTLGERELTLIIYTYTTTGEISCGDTIRQTILTTEEGDCNPCDLVADFSVPADTICLAELVTLSNLSSEGDSSRWLLNDNWIGTSLGTADFEYTFDKLTNAATKDLITLIVYKDGAVCQDDTSQAVVISDEGKCQNCTIPIELDTDCGNVICAGDSCLVTIATISFANLFATGLITDDTQLHWYLNKELKKSVRYGDDPANAIEFYTVFETIGPANVTLNLETPNCNQSSDTITVSVMSPPDAGFIYEYQENNDGRYTVYFFANETDADLYNWNYGEGGNGNQEGATPFNAYTKTDSVYQVCLTITKNSCINDSCIYVPGGPACAAISPSDTMTIEEGDSITFENHSKPIPNASMPVQYHWLVKDGIEITYNDNSDFTYTFVDTGTYVVQLVLQQGNFTDTATVTIKVIARRVNSCDFEVTIQEGDTTICADTPITIHLHQADSTLRYQWRINDVWTTNEEDSYTLSFPGSGNDYTLVAIGTKDDCPIASDTLLISVISSSEAQFIYSIKPNQTVSFANYTMTSDPNATYLWDFGDEQSSTQKNPIHQYESEAAYTVCLEVTTPHCGVEKKTETCETINWKE